MASNFSSTPTSISHGTSTVKGDDYATIDLATLAVRESFMKKGDLKKALAIVVANREVFEGKWDEFFKR